MTDYDRGEFVRNRTITIEPCANGTFLVRQGDGPEGHHPFGMFAGGMGFSSAADMIHFLQSEYSIDPRGQPEAPNDQAD